MRGNIAARPDPQYHRNMLAALAALCLAMPQDPAVVDAPAWSSTEWSVALRRPFDDWVFLPETQRGTTTVIFQPRDGSLSSQRWGALILSSFTRAPALGELAQRRITRTWQPQLGPGFRLLANDSLDVGGLPARHVVMTGIIDHVILDIEEYLVLRGEDLIALQFRYPSGTRRDSLGAGYHRSLEGLAIGGRGAADAVTAEAPAPARSSWTTTIDRNAVVFDLPRDAQAIAPGWLSSEIVGTERRLMRWNALVGAPDTVLYAVGQFHVEPRRFGNLTLRVWRNDAPDSAVTRATDRMLDTLAAAWQVYWRAFGAVPTADVSVVETAWRETRGGAAVVYLGRDAAGLASSYILRRELSRTWWGGVVRSDGDASALTGALALWSAELATPVIPPGSLDHIIGRIQAMVGTAVFREAIRTLLVESRGTAPALDSFYGVLGDSAAARLRRALR